MSPTSETPQDPNIIEATAVEKEVQAAAESANIDQQVMPESPQAEVPSGTSLEHVDPADDPTLIVTRAPRPEARTRKMGLRGKVAAGVAAVSLTVAGAVAGVNALSDNGDAEPKKSSDKTEQVDEVTTTTEAPVSPTADVEVDGVDPNSPVTSINESLPTQTTPEQSVDNPIVDVTPAEGDSPSIEERIPGPGEITTPISNEQDATPESYVGERSVRNTVMLADYMMGNQALTGLNPTIDNGPNGTATFSFAGPDFSISVYGKFDAASGTLVQDQPTSYTRGLLRIDVSHNGQTVSVKSDDLNDIPAILVEADGRIASTDSNKFEGSENDPEFASRRAGEIIKAVSVLAGNSK